jgi:hypothetical protein
MIAAEKRTFGTSELGGVGLSPLRFADIRDVSLAGRSKA